MAHTAQRISEHLMSTWQFLSGEARPFSPWPVEAAPPYLAHGFYLPIDIQGTGTHCGVAVLLCHDDALAAATHMLGLAPADLSEADVNDACSEVCNVLSASAFPELSESNHLSIGLPVALDAAAYADTHRSSRLAAAYQSQHAGKALYVMVYEPIVPVTA